MDGDCLGFEKIFVILLQSEIQDIALSWVERVNTLDGGLFRHLGKVTSIFRKTSILCGSLT